MRNYNRMFILIRFIQTYLIYLLLIERHVNIFVILIYKEKQIIFLLNSSKDFFYFLLIEAKI